MCLFGNKHYNIFKRFKCLMILISHQSDHRINLASLVKIVSLNMEVSRNIIFFCPIGFYKRVVRYWQKSYFFCIFGRHVTCFEVGVKKFGKRILLREALKLVWLSLYKYITWKWNNNDNLPFYIPQINGVNHAAVFSLAVNGSVLQGAYEQVAVRALAWSFCTD